MSGPSPLARLKRSARFWPPNWPIRWKLTAVTAGLTFFLLVIFGVVVGQLTTQSLRDDFGERTKTEARDLATEIDQGGYLTAGSASPEVQLLLDRSPDWANLILPANGTITKSTGAPYLGPLETEGLSTWRGTQVATVSITEPPAFPGGPRALVAVVRVGRSLEDLDRRVNSVWLSIVAGIIGASLLAGLASAILSERALAPLARLTQAAAEVARTRDPSVTLSEPDGEDEVVDLTRSFNEMLKELSAARGDRERALARQREFVADASHELRTPLTSILANLELLGESRHLSSADGESLESAMRSGHRMRRLVEDLQILARSDAGNHPPFETCDLQRIAGDVAAELDAISDGHRIVVEAGPPVEIEGLPDALHRMVLNLVDNAIKHTPEGTEIEIEVLGDHDDESRLIVSDDGPGIPEEMQTRIFDRFVRDRSSADRSAGPSSGLGLAIVAAIARQHGGTATVGRSSTGGARFEIEFPS